MPEPRAPFSSDRPRNRQFESDEELEDFLAFTYAGHDRDLT